MAFQRDVFSSEHESFRDTVRRFISEYVTPYHGDWEKAGCVDRRVWFEAGERGLLCPSVPEAYGGPGGDFLYGAIVVEEVARAGASGLGFSVHSEMVAPYILHYGTEALKARWLPDMASGRAIGAIGMSEPGAGSDLQSIRTDAVRDGDEYIITGQKVFISNGQLCDFIVLACKTDPQAGAKGVSLILVEADRPGFRRGANLEKIGWKAQDTSELFFDEVRVPVANLLGAEGMGFIQLMQVLPQERLTQAIRATAMLEAALEWTIDYVSQRSAFGKKIADFQNTRFKLADVKSQVVMLRVFVDQCMKMHVKGQLESIDAAMVKLLASEALCDCLDECLQLFGGYGYMWEYPIARAWADARMGRIAGGTCEIMRDLIGRKLVEKP